MTRLPTWLRAAIITSAQAFAGTVLALFLAVVPELLGWINGGTIPDLATYAKLLAGAVAAFVTGVVTAIYRKLKPIEQSYPDAIETTAVDITGPGLDEIAVNLRQDLQAYIDDYGWGGVKNALELLRPATPVIPPKEH
jgi:hypothetical protein